MREPQQVQLLGNAEEDAQAQLHQEQGPETEGESSAI
jgi:hypothetical protein